MKKIILGSLLLGILFGADSSNSDIKLDYSRKDKTFQSQERVPTAQYQYLRATKCYCNTP